VYISNPITLCEITTRTGETIAKEIGFLPIMMLNCYKTNTLRHACYYSALPATGHCGFSKFIGGSSELQLFDLLHILTVYVIPRFTRQSSSHC
jgi:hypothetical protein